MKVKIKNTQNSRIQSDAQSILDSIRKIVKSLREASKQSEKEVGVSAAQLFVLQKIAESEKPLRINDLAIKTLTHQSSVSVVITKLVEKSLVERIPSKKDARAMEVRLSKRGADLIRSNKPLIQERLMDGIFLLSPTERRGLVLGLRVLLEKAGLQGEEPSLFFEENAMEKS